MKVDLSLFVDGDVPLHLEDEVADHLADDVAVPGAVLVGVELLLFAVGLPSSEVDVLVLDG